MTQPNYKFSVPAQVFHWLIAALIAFQVPLAWTMKDLPMGPDKIGNYALHKSIGITIFAIAALRLAWRWLRPPPPLPADLARHERVLAHATHTLLYVTLFALPLTGWLSSSAANFSVSFFKLFTLPDLVAPNHALHEALEETHKVLGWLLLTLLALHIVAALVHHFGRKDNVLRSMLPFVRMR